MQADADHTLAEVLPLQHALDEIDAERLSKGGSFATGAQTAVPGESACNEVLNHCYELLADCGRKAQDVSPEMKASCRADVYDQLRRIKNALRRLLGKRHHTAEDLRHYQSQLEKIDGERKDGVFCGDLEARALQAAAACCPKGIIPHGQAAASGLLDECYDLIEQLAGSAEDMSPEMREILGQLEQYRHELEGMLRRQRTHEELREVQEKLDAVDDERQAHAGIFAHHAAEAGKPPPGQDVLLHDLYADMAAAEQ
ncbi:hypothetical protein CHLNCDRAFT_134458 [Chlorella variabilis]|uniref:Uncharacterized protein n=1 Tax=Chlorella variabilis TaxID=554065 RepID=E1ZG11_CHLVA|nr:hypothetical protein CHLNCDRAFT_134458 [Chlorella variabilis]EFN55216.1 hypothetical protein CHLNCDRAFT_134458 [Chlorella variabilis]|eukprot:XP_005847318.1 hypothetical protein CHLNCDRAFT_134458 [Chlorella variabilis]